MMLMVQRLLNSSANKAGYLPTYQPNWQRERMMMLLSWKLIKFQSMCELCACVVERSGRRMYVQNSSGI